MKKEQLIQLLELRKDKRYRAGVLQAACLFDVITHREWQMLFKKYVCKKNES